MPLLWVERDGGRWRRLLLRVQDNGRGITEEEIRRQGSLGLLGMKERVTLAGGTLDMKGEAGVGTTLTIQIPLAAKPPVRS
jgi:signal transduction histidine kinase